MISRGLECAPSLPSTKDQTLITHNMTLIFDYQPQLRINGDWWVVMEKFLEFAGTLFPVKP